MMGITVLLIENEEDGDIIKGKRRWIVD